MDVAGLDETASQAQALAAGADRGDLHGIAGRPGLGQAHQGMRASAAGGRGRPTAKECAAGRVRE